MSDILAKLSDQSLFYSIAASVTLLCVFFSAWITLTFLRHSPRLFTAMALFTCSWMLVAGAYGAADEPKLSDLATDIAAFLFVYIGGLLVADARSAQPGGTSSVSGLQTTAMGLLLFIAVPRALDFPGPIGQVTRELFGVTGLSVAQTKLVVSEILVLAGFWSLARGAREVCGGMLLQVLVVILVCYALLSVARSVDIWIEYRRMGVFFVYGFALAKLALTITFGVVVLRAAKPESVRGQPVPATAH